MPAYSTLDMVYEVYEAIASLPTFQYFFTLNEIVERINKNRKDRNENRRTSRESIDRILNKLFLPLQISKVSEEKWEKSTGPMQAMLKVRPEIVEKVIQNQGISATPEKIAFWIGLGKLSTSHRAYLCYPYSNNPLKNSLELLVLLIHLYPKAKEIFTPATPHEMYWGLEERENREAAMNECRDLILKCDFLLNCQKRGDTPSKGMKSDIEIAQAEKKPIKYIKDYLGYYPDVNAIMIDSGLARFVPVSGTPKLTPVVTIPTSPKKNK